MPFLVIHPDKTPHARAPDAFDLLKKVCQSTLYVTSSLNIGLQAESELSDTTKREELDAIVKQARTLILKDANLPSTVADSDERLRDMNPPFKQQLRAKSKELLIDEEVRRRKSVLLLDHCLIPVANISLQSCQNELG